MGKTGPAPNKDDEVERVKAELDAVLKKPATKKRFQQARARLSESEVRKIEDRCKRV